MFGLFKCSFGYFTFQPSHLICFLVRESRDEIPLRGKAVTPPVLVSANHELKFANQEFNLVFSVNRVRAVNIDLAVFEHIFLSNPSSKSTFVQQQSCGSSLPLQLLFWPNFMFLYENLSFEWSKLSKKSVKRITVDSLFVTVLGAHTATDRR